MKNKTGGKGHKRQKNKEELDNNKKITYATDGQDYGILIKKLGNGIMLVQKPYSDKKEKEVNQVLGVVRGKIKKRVIFSSGDFILFSYRGELNKYSKQKVDIIHKYDNKEKREIKKNVNNAQVNNLFKMDIEDYKDDIDNDNCYFDYSEDEDEDDDAYGNDNSYTKVGNQNRNYDLSSSDDESEYGELDDDDISNI
jgi:initiation factor 1A